MKSTTQKLWAICCVSAVVVVLIGFTSLTIPESVFEPRLFGLPYSLWVSILLSILLVVLTILGTLVHPGKQQSEEE